jgi:addiction module HigA family antidote
MSLILDAIDGATCVGDLRGARGFHALVGDRSGSFAMSVSGNRRLTFRFEHGDQGDVFDVDFEGRGNNTTPRRRDMTMTGSRTRRPSLPGEILAELYLTPHNVSIAKFAEAVGVTRKHMSAIVNGRAAITADTATRIAVVLGTTAQYWLNLQNAVDLYDAQERLAESKLRPQLMAVFG